MALAISSPLPTSSANPSKGKHCSTNYPSKRPEEVSHWLSTHPGTDHVVGRCQSDTCYIIPWFHAQFSLSKLKKLEEAV